MSFIWRHSKLAMGGSIFSTITKNIWEASKKNANTMKIFVTVRIRLSFKWRQMANSTSWTTITGISQGRSAVGLKKWAALLEIKWRTQVRVWGEWHQLEVSRKWCLWIIRGNLAHIWFPVRKKNKNDIFALHNSAPINSILEVTNPMNKRSIFVKVIGRPSRNVYFGPNVKVVLTPKVAKMLGARDSRFYVNINYLK